MTSRQRFIATALVASLTIGSLPVSAQAGIVSTEQATGQGATAEAGARDRVNAFFARDDVRRELQAQGVSPADAATRVQAMTDTEVAQLAHRIDKAPAGGDVVGVIFTIFIVLLITDILGFTKVFPFTRSVR